MTGVNDRGLPGRPQLSLVCYSCRKSKTHFVRVDLSEEERAARYLSYICSSCAFRQQRSGAVAPALEALNFYHLNARRLLEDILRFYRETEREGEYGELYERRRRREIEETEKMREEMERAFNFFEATYDRHGLDRPDPDWKERYERAAAERGLKTNFTQG